MGLGDPNELSEMETFRQREEGEIQQELKFAGFQTLITAIWHKLEGFFAYTWQTLAKWHGYMGKCNQDLTFLFFSIQ